MRFQVLALAIAAVGLAGPARAQLGPAMDDKETVVESLVVRGFGGPPWWKVQSGESTVYVLASPGSVPKDLKFDHKLLDRRIKTATSVIVPPKVTYNSVDSSNVPPLTRLFQEMNQFRQADLEPSLSPALRARFAAARAAIRQPEYRYGALSPGLAGMALAADTAIIKSAGGKGLPSFALQDVVEASARRSRVRLEPAGVYGADTLTAILEDARKTDEVCLSAVLDQLAQPPNPEEAPERLREVAQAWAEGDVRPLLDNLRRAGDRRALLFTFERQDPVRRDEQVVNLRIFEKACVGEMPALQAVQARWVSDQVAAIEKALKKPGHAVAVLDAGVLLVSGGVLDQLRQKGFTIVMPDVE
ncbi:MAG TPA: TraB/GumN family protein [Caulobacteraceae bacterium]|nr:TraB/GumN family protein [Caulobacteraceae bacterium]